MKDSSIGFQNKDWGSARKKQSRQESVFDTYRTIMGRNSLLGNKQYWTLCGKHVSDSCEFPHALSAGIITAQNQFHGIDRVPEIIIHNRRLHPQANWHTGEVDEVIDQVPDFNPGLINLDTVNMTEKACSLFAQMLFVLVERGVTDCLLVVNHLLNNPRERGEKRERCHTLDFFINRACSTPAGKDIIRMAAASGWLCHDRQYVYPGADNRSNSLMHTVYFYEGGRK